MSNLGTIIKNAGGERVKGENQGNYYHNLNK